MDAGQLVQNLAWPAVTLIIVLFLLIYYKKFLSDIVIQIGPIVITAKMNTEKLQAAASIAAAMASKAGGSTAKENLANDEQSREIADTVNKIMPRQLRRLADASVLWVDDNPSYNYYEKKSLEVFGIHFTDSQSTMDALEKLRVNKYDVIISDMGRTEDKLAGYKLLEEKQKLGDSSNLPEHKEEARRKGALGSTNNPKELFQLVLSAIQSE
jgi:CheY-like chemotaxis protein